MSENLRVKASKFIDETTRISFKFNGTTYYGFKGDTLASALISNNVHLVGRSFKYHRPRGIMTAGSEEPNAIVQLGSDNALTEPNVRTTEVEIYEGLEASSQNCWPSVNFDIGGINNILSPFLPAGFYYKTFMWPKNFWYKIYEPIIRKAAGLGVAPLKPDPDRYEHKFEYCDVLVAGSGPSGLASALAAAKNGARVLLAEDKPRFGGSLLTDEITIGNKKGKDWADETIAQLKSMPNVIVKNRSQVFGYYDHNMMVMFERTKDHIENPTKFTPRQRLWYIRAKEVIISTGSIERPLVFGNNDRPGIMLASAAKEYMKVYGVLVGKKPIIFTNNDSAYDAAIEFKKNGIDPQVVDVRTDSESSVVKEAKNLNIDIKFSHGVVNTKGYLRVNSATIGKLNSAKSGYENLKNVSCDCICVSGNWTPTVHLSSQSGNKLKFDEKINAFIPNQSKQNESTIGSANGSFTLKKSLDDGFSKGYELSNKITGKNTKSTTPTSNERNYAQHDKFWCMPLPKNKHYKRCVDFQNDATAKDIKLALREGFRSIEHVKRYTTTGMGTDQGKLGNMHALGIVADTAGVKVGELGTTTFRPPYTPLPFGTIVGRNVGEFFDIFRKTPMHEWHEKNNAKFENVGQWKRAWFYPINNESMDEAVQRESKAARESAGILDASTLGKIDIQGTDASEFLNRVYTNAWSKLGIGKCRYGLMLNEDGMVYDDGVSTRLDENHYIMTTTTGGAANVMGKLEDFLQTEWPELDVFLTSVTDHFATISVCGPNSRKILNKIIPDLDLSDENFPHMSFKNSRIGKIKCRVMRISFTGEHSYEINIQANYGKSVWEKCMEAGKEFNITPYGTEAMHLLRAEKGFIITGQDTDGTITPIDLQMDWIVSKKKYDFIGKRSLYRSDTIREDRKQLVGLITDDPNEVLEEGAQIVSELNKKPVEMLGHVTSSYFSPNLNKSIALAVVRSGKNMLGKKLFIPMKNKTIKVTIENPVFFDKENKRLNA